MTVRWMNRSLGGVVFIGSRASLTGCYRYPTLIATTYPRYLGNVAEGKAIQSRDSY